jgi:hypothetical protein
MNKSRIFSSVLWLILMGQSFAQNSATKPTFSIRRPASITTLTANVTTFTLAAGVDGQEKTLIFCQNAIGHFTVAGPSNVRGLGTVDPNPSTCSAQHWIYSVGQSAWIADRAMTSTHLVWTTLY